MKRVYVNEEWCLGCHLCEYNCAFANSGMTDMATALKGKPIYPRIHIEGNDISLGQKRVLALLPNAYMQGHTAGVNMSGGREVFDKAIPMNSIGFFGLHVMTAGTYDGEMYEEKTDSTLKRLFTKDGLLKGFILIGKTERAGIYTSLIRERTPLDTIDFDTMKKIATSIAFSPENRRKKFGSVV